MSGGEGDEGNLYQFRSSRSPSQRTPRGAAKKDDPWSLDDGLDYAPDKFYTGSRDTEKESISVVASIPRSLNGHIEAIVQGAKIPYYKTKQDFIRDAIHHRLYFVKNHLTDEHLERLLAAALATAAAERRLREIEDYEEAIRAFEKAFEASLRTDHPVIFRETMVEAERTLASWPMSGSKERLASLITRYERLSSSDAD